MNIVPREGVICGRIVEVEAYTQGDSASHSFKGKTLRNSPIFGDAGNAYIYFTYGMHYCLNIVNGKVGQGEAVLIRALEPLLGIELMKLNRKTNEVYNLTNGPAKLMQALGIPKDLNGSSLLNGSNLQLKIPRDGQAFEIIADKRIGITRSKENLWRFYIKDSPYIRKK